VLLLYLSLRLPFRFFTTTRRRPAASPFIADSRNTTLCVVAPEVEVKVVLRARVEVVAVLCVVRVRGWCEWWTRTCTCNITCDCCTYVFIRYLGNI